MVFAFGFSLLSLHYKGVVNRYLKMKDILIFLARFIMLLSYIPTSFYNKTRVRKKPVEQRQQSRE
jgi:hypothetical protein